MEPLQLAPADKDYKRENQTVQWPEVVPLIGDLIKAVVVEIYHADVSYVARTPFDSVGEPIEKFIARLKLRLETDFPTSPPFTIYHLTETLLLKVPGFEPTRGLKTRFHEFKTTIRNTVTNDETVIEADNNYYQSGSASTETHENEVSALKYLRALERCILVQTSIEEINQHLAEYGSRNTTDSRGEMQPEDSSCIQMSRIGWIDEMRALAAQDATTEASPKRLGSEPEEDRLVKRTKNERDQEDGKSNAETGKPKDDLEDESDISTGDMSVD
ncbi:hypothetical protein KL930_002262 [Ogataea haglerorum]|uniref:Uncharacterized protein n=1 Tax=Ogataea haglerorum TaxID=1937702 RepID=A0ABQ7RLX6_9ASCO|nr:hypothetical protein KL915_001242 [Ogataea haglerorum]KAG7709992.1 hypothetical protein KL914_000902 [Ogataea haglerorum]KAG7720524.1 hypothetical protein KL913_001424 [Ogataea haglerorum]KAG7720910.1 hypothetical protein KL949_001782 [Ogataea haglerorum]KAG7743963.1 hypothetical protein KL932_001286 [Ogataea haglerorum]